MHSPRRFTATTLVTLSLASARTSSAEDPRRAVDRFEPSERGSEWLANESLDLRGHLRPSLGYVLSFARRPLVVEGRAPVKDLAVLHLGGAMVLAQRLRLGLSLPLQLAVGGESAVADGATFIAPPKDGGVGDLRLAADVRIAGEHGRPFTAAFGVQAWAPTGQKSQWMSDGTFRARPRVMIAGERGLFAWAAQGGLLVREQPELTAAIAAGARIGRSVVVGPEAFASTSTASPLARKETPIEVLLGAHWLIEGAARLGGGFGCGIGEGLGAPAWRAIVSLEWAPSTAAPGARPPVTGGGAGAAMRPVPPPDSDGDGVPDDADACPRDPGVATDDRQTNGCPPDADDDGVDDLHDACPTVRGAPSSDPRLNGCPDPDPDHDGVPAEVDACPEDAGPADVDPARNGCPRAFARGDRIVMLDPIVFAPGTAALATTPDNEALLTAILGAMLRLPEVTRFRIEGHTDDRSDRQLGAARAAAVASFLAAHGIDRARLSTEGIGPARPIATNATEAGRAQNRRIEIHLGR